MRGRNALPRTPYVFDRKGEPSHAVSERPERKSGRPAAGIAQQGRDRPAGAAGARCREHRPHGDPAGQARKHRGHPHVHGAAAAALQARAGHIRSPCARYGRGRGRRGERHRGRGRERRSHGIGGGRSRQGGRPPRAGAGERRLRGAPGQAGERSGAGGRWRRMDASAGTRREPFRPVGGPGPSLPAKRILRQTLDEAARHHQRRRRSQP